MLHQEKNNIYKTLGLTYLAPDYESISHIREVLDNYSMPYNIVDPNDMSSIGLNPFVFEDPIKTFYCYFSSFKENV